MKHEESSGTHTFYLEAFHSSQPHLGPFWPQLVYSLVKLELGTLPFPKGQLFYAWSWSLVGKRKRPDRLWIQVSEAISHIRAGQKTYGNQMHKAARGKNLSRCVNSSGDSYQLLKCGFLMVRLQYCIGHNATRKLKPHSNLNRVSWV